jgi:hypothetical protein
MVYFLHLCALQNLVLSIVFGDCRFDLLIVSNHQALWLLYMSIAFPSNLSQLVTQYFLQNPEDSRYYRHKVRSTDKRSLLEI